MRAGFVAAIASINTTTYDRGGLSPGLVPRQNIRRGANDIRNVHAEHRIKLVFGQYCTDIT